MAEKKKRNKSSQINNSKILSRVSCPNCSFESTVPISKYNHLAQLRCPQPDCRSKFTYNKNNVFDTHQYPDLSPDAFTHSLDRNSIASLRKIPGLNYAFRKMMEYGYEKELRVNSMADDVKVTTKTCGYIHDMAEQAAKCLDIAMPDVFINQDPHPNAFTFGVEFPLITIQSGLIELLNEDELFAVIAHEMTHIKCHHVLYQMLANFLVSASGNLGLVGSFIIPLNLALLEWSRKAELSADRGALIVTNNKASSMKFLMKLAGGSEKVASMIDETDFALQADQLNKMTEKWGMNKLFKVISNLSRTHPFPVLRAAELNKWADSDEYKAIYNGDYVKREKKAASSNKEITRCPHCGEELNSDLKYCEGCGQTPDKLDPQYNGGNIKDMFNKAKGLWSSGNKSNKKVCPECSTEYFEPDDRYCPIDGKELIDERRDN